MVVIARARRSVVPMDWQALMRRACRDAGLLDFDDDQLGDVVRLLLESYNAEAHLSLIGRLIARKDTLRLLTTRLQLVEEWKRHPEYALQEVRRPIFVAGLPRSGTTLLHNLFTQDPANRVPLTWEVMSPLPPPERASYQTDPRIVKAERQLKWFARLVPEFKKIHPLGARLPQECIAILSYAFESSRFHTMYNAPSYQAWLTGRDLFRAYDFHRRFLQHLQWRCAGERWVLKAPSHLFGLEAIFRTYPDARVVQTHRDPLEVMASTASLTAALRRACSYRIDIKEIGVEVTRRWATGLARAMAFRDAEEHVSKQFVDVQYASLMGNPMGTMRRVYDELGLVLTAQTKANMQHWLARNPKDKYGEHRYSLEQFGLSEKEETLRFHTYRDRFGVAASA